MFPFSCSKQKIKQRYHEHIEEVPTDTGLTKTEAELFIFSFLAKIGYASYDQISNNAKVQLPSYNCTVMYVALVKLKLSGYIKCDKKDGITLHKISSEGQKFYKKLFEYYSHVYERMAEVLDLIRLS